MKQPFLLFLLFVSFFISIGMKVEDVPKTTLASPVGDYGSVIGPHYSALITQIIHELEQATSAEMTLITIDSLEGLTAEDYSEKLFKVIGPGKKDKDNGILMLFSLSDKKLRVETGYGLEGVLADALTGQLMDDHAIPRFKDGEYGRGLYELAKATALHLAFESGAQLVIPEPTTWPPQIAVPESKLKENSHKRIPLQDDIFYYLLFFLVGFPLIKILIRFARVKFLKAKAAKTIALGSHKGVSPSIWWVSGLAAVPIAFMSERIWESFSAFFIMGGLASYAEVVSRKALRKFVEVYKRFCPKCKKPMGMLSLTEENKILNDVEESEQSAGGMDYEFWRCGTCDHLERLEVTLGRATKCPHCKRRTLVSKSTTITSATTSSSGSERVNVDCHNKGCGHHQEFIRYLPKISRSSSSSSGSGSSGGSFGGGRSGGGGATRSW